MKVFVTVGTTSFDRLIDTINSPEILKQLTFLGYDEIVMQIGAYKGNLRVAHPIKHFSTFHYKDCIEEEMKGADLVVSHAGAGCCMEVLRLAKPLLVVVNRDLMDDHQSELAYQLTHLKHAFMCHCSTLSSTLQSIETHSLKKYELGNPKNFLKSINHLMLNSGNPHAPRFVSFLLFLSLLPLSVLWLLSW